MFAVVILTLNEERALPGCLRSVQGCGEVVVVDSGSTDRTLAIARAAGARVVEHPFQSFAQQRNQVQRSVRFRHPWVFHLDADERFTPELFAECAAWPDDAPFDGAWVAPRMLLEGTWIRRSTDYPTYQVRFVQAERFRWIDAGHGQREAPGLRLATLRSSYTHEVLSHGEADWRAKHRRYAAEEARAQAATSVDHPGWRGLFSGDRVRRRRSLKHLSRHLPARGFCRFVYQYGLRGGFLDGAAGWRYCRLLAAYERDVARARRRLALPATAADQAAPAGPPR